MDSCATFMMWAISPARALVAASVTHAYRWQMCPQNIQVSTRWSNNSPYIDYTGRPIHNLGQTYTTVFRSWPLVLYSAEITKEHASVETKSGTWAYITAVVKHTRYLYVLASLLERSKRCFAPRGACARYARSQARIEEKRERSRHMSIITVGEK